MWYMGLKNNIPVGWTQTDPPEHYIAVSDEVRAIHETHPDYVWNGTSLVAPSPEQEYTPTHTELLMRQIISLEQQITNRRLREAILGTDNGWLADVEAQIASLREGLNG